MNIKIMLIKLMILQIYNYLIRKILKNTVVKKRISISTIKAPETLLNFFTSYLINNS